MTTTILSAPFTHGANSVQRTMFLVLLALAPATLFNFYLFGWPAIFMFFITIGACVGIEAWCLRLSGKPVKPALADYSAVLTGWLLAMSLPPWAPWWLCVLGAVFAIAMAKHSFGGLGQNVFNPAMVGRTVLLISFPVEMTTWIVPNPLFSANAPGLLDALAITFGGTLPDAMSSASALGHVRTELSRHIPVTESLAHTPGLMDLLFGFRAGSMGETSAVLLLAGGAFLLFKRVISWHIPAGMLGGLFVIAAIFHQVDPARFAPATFHLLTGGAIIGAFFIATDYVTSPVTRKGQLIFAIGCGVMTWLIRNFAGYPEGVAFAVLLMNGMAPIIDRYTRPRTFGRTSKGDPLPMVKEKS